MTHNEIDQIRALLRTGELNQAMKVVNETLAREPENDDALNLRARIYAQSGDNMSAWEDLSRVIELRMARGDETVHAARINSAIVSLDMGDTESAVSQLRKAERALRGKPSHSAAAGNLSYALFRAKDFTSAAQVASDALRELKLMSPDQRAPSHQLQELTITLNLADALDQLGEHAEARRWRQDVCEHTSNQLWPALHARAQQGTAEQLIREGASPEEIAQARKHVVLGLRAARLSAEAPHIFESLKIAARHQLRLGQPKRAQRHASAAMLICPSKENVPELYDLLASIREQIGDHEGALCMLRWSQKKERQSQAILAERHLRMLHIRHAVERSKQQAKTAELERKRAENLVREKVAELTYQATHDQLTNLPNRGLFEQHVGEHIARHQQDPKSGRFALALIDLDRFKVINDSMGHAAGDRLIREVSARLREAAQDDELIARMGGDEFLLMIPAPDDQTVNVRAEALVGALRRPLQLDGSPLAISSSMGIAVWPDEALNTSDLLKLADQAMYHAKRTGHTHARHNPARGQPTNSLQLERTLTQAVLRNEFNLIYQPIINLTTGRIESAEALMRWTAPDGRPVSPGVFIPLLEETGMIEQVGRWTILQAWKELERSGLKASVNVSPRQLHVQRLDQVIEEGLAIGLDPCRLQLEITESSLVLDPERSAELLRKIRNRGVSIAIDDFGTGHANLLNLRRLPANVLKIDRSFCAELGTPQGNDLVKVLRDLARVMDMKVVLEGVEETAQEQAAREISIEYGQGWLYHRGVGAGEVKQMIGEVETSAQPRYT